ncbi:MAG: hypothetical protein ABI175_16985 [Polyangiales bacterium]
MNTITLNPRPRHVGLAALLVVLAVGCSKADAPAPGPVTEQQVNPKTARLAPGDLVPSRINALPTAKDLPTDTIALSSPSSPKVAVGYGVKIDTIHVKETFLFVEPGSMAGSLDIPVDVTEGSSVHVLPKISEETGYLATLKDVQVLDPAGKRLDVRAAKPVLDQAAPLAIGASPQPLATKEVAPLNSFPLEAKAPVGGYAMKVGAVAAKNGVAVHVQMPQSKIDMALTPSTTQLYFGDEGSVGIQLTDDGAPITGASLEGHLVNPDGTKGAGVTFKEIGGGAYEALVSKSLSIGSEQGIYNVFVRAKGLASGKKFDRFGAAAMAFVVPTGKISTASTPRIVTDSAGKIASIDVDVAVEAASTDRFEVSAIIAANGPDGSERPIAEAQTAQVLSAGIHTITLHFAGGDLSFAKLEGPFVVRKLQLFSQGSFVMLHRVGYAFDLRLPELKLADLAAPLAIRPAVQEMLDRGEFDLLAK